MASCQIAMDSLPSTIIAASSHRSDRPTLMIMSLRASAVASTLASTSITVWCRDRVLRRSGRSERAILAASGNALALGRATSEADVLDASDAPSMCRPMGSGASSTVGSSRGRAADDVEAGA
jgi:hypothetical protein